MASSFKHDYAAFGEAVLASDFMVEEMKRRALLVADRALTIAPFSDEDDGDHYIDHFRVEADVRQVASRGGGRRAVGRVINDHEAAVDIEYGTGLDEKRPQGGSSPRHRVLGRSLDAAGDG